jgi:hypothetical protein
MQAIVTEQLMGSGWDSDARWQAYRSARFSHLHVEHTYYVSGPPQADAARAAVDIMLDQLLAIMHAGKHLLHVMTVRAAQ